jgi:RNA polymerase sigma factor (sigma-70 family)
VNSEPSMLQDVLLAKNGDRDAFGRLVVAYERRLYGLAKMYLKRDEDCADAIQEAILKSYRALRSLKEPAYFKRWLFRILIRECIQLLRMQKRMRIIQSGFCGETVVGLQETVALKEAVAGLDNDLRVVVQLHYFKDLPVKQIAELVGVPAGTVKSRLHRARMILAEILESPDERRIDYDPIIRGEHWRKRSAPLPIPVPKRVVQASMRILLKHLKGRDIHEQRTDGGCLHAL